MFIRNENQRQLDMQSNIIKEQSELNDKLKKDNFTLKEQNEYLEKINTNLVEDISSIKLSHQGIQEETENKFKDMCENYDNVSILVFQLKYCWPVTKVAWTKVIGSRFQKP